MIAQQLELTRLNQRPHGLKGGITEADETRTLDINWISDFFTLCGTPDT